MDTWAGWALGILLAAILVDCLIGEYPPALHPVVWIGTATSALLRLAPAKGWWRQLIFGAGLTVIICGVTVGLTILTLHLATGVPVLEAFLGIFLLKASFALCALRRAAVRVVSPLQAGDLAAGREALRSLCSRDPSDLESEDLIAATIESLAENASDSFIAPLFYYMLLGVPGALGYRAINTLDAMIGYRGRFEALGKVAARLDDLVNWVPARLTAGLLLLAGCLTGKKVAVGWRILRRDGRKTPSPNGGRPMAVMAGLLGVELSKKGVYVLGDPSEPLTPNKVYQAWHLVAVTGGLMILLCALVLIGATAAEYLLR